MENVFLHKAVTVLCPLRSWSCGWSGCCWYTLFSSCPALYWPIAVGCCSAGSDVRNCHLASLSCRKLWVRLCSFHQVVLFFKSETSEVRTDCFCTFDAVMGQLVTSYRRREVRDSEDWLSCLCSYEAKHHYIGETPFDHLYHIIYFLFRETVPVSGHLHTVTAWIHLK